MHHEANVIKQHLSNQKKNTFNNSKSTALDIASFIREDVEAYRDKEVNITARGEDIVEQARKGTHEVLMTELVAWRDPGNEAMVTDAASDVGLLVADTACDKTVGTAYYLDCYENEVLRPLGLQSVSEPEEETFRFGPANRKCRGNDA